METTAEITKVYTIKLTEKEAILLKGMVQNPLGPDEHESITQWRKSIWESLTEAGVEVV